MKKKINKLTALTAAVTACAMLLAACGGGSSSSGSSGSGSSSSGSSTTATQAAAAASTDTSNVASLENIENDLKTDETLVVMLQAEPTALCALNGTATESALIIAEAMGGTLFEYDSDNRDVLPNLATGYETIDELHYRFTLRDGIEFADGTPITADDVVYSFTQYAAAGISSANYFKPDEFAVEDDKTFVIALKKYIPGWYYLVAESSLPIYSEAAVEAVGGIEAAERDVPVGCGRYNFCEWKSGEYIMLERNENYWDDSYNGYYKYIKFMFVGDAASRVLAVQSGDANLGYLITQSDVLSLKGDPQTDTINIPVDAIYNVFYNVSSEKMSDPKLREAVSYAIDPESVNVVVNMGNGTPVQGLYAPTFKYNHDVYEGGSLEFDLDKAKAALAESNYSSGTTLELITLAANQTIATVVQENLRQIGIEVNISILEQSVYVQEARAGNYDMQVGTTTLGTVQPNCFNQIAEDTMGSSVSQIFCHDEELQNAIAAARSSDEATQAQGFSDIIDYIFTNYCLRGLCTQQKSCAVTAGLTGLVSGTRMGYIDVSYIHPAN